MVQNVESNFTDERFNYFKAAGCNRLQNSLLLQFGRIATKFPDFSKHLEK